MQLIGCDLGRGFVKGYTEVNGKSKECLFKSVVGDAREMDFSKFENPIYLEVNNHDYFVGNLAEKESFNTIPNFSDSKVSNVASQLLYALLEKLAIDDTVGLMLGVPNKQFTKATLSEVRNKFLGLKVEIKNKITGRSKTVTIGYIKIFRESDAALYSVVATHKDRIALKNKRLGMVTVGFRTTELTYFDKNLKFNDKFSMSKEMGNRTILDLIQNNISKKGISKSLHEIDTENDYDALKNIGYKALIERVHQELEMNWINLREMRLFIAGGTAKNFKEIPSQFELVADPQMITARGLFYVAEMELR